MEKMQRTKPPSTVAKDLEEKRLGIALSNIRQSLIKPYMRVKDRARTARVYKKSSWFWRNKKDNRLDRWK